MDNKRLLLWMAITLGTIFLLSQVRAWFFPAPPAAPQADAPKQEPKPADAKPKPLTPEEQAAVQAAVLRALLPHAPPLLLEMEVEKARLLLARREWEKTRIAQEKANQPPPPPDTEIVLGDPQKTKLIVTFSTQNAAVKSIVLPQHQRATADFGRHDPNERKLLLLSDQEAVQGSPAERQSYRLLVGNEPLAWKLKGREADNKLVFEADVPGKALKVRKTFTLPPDAYHLNLEITFEGTDPEVKYELTGPRGLPVEAMKWRQQPFRYLVTCVTKPGEPETPIRYLDEHAKLVKGDLKERTLTDPQNPLRLVYAGVMLQFFSALVVVDREPGQPPPALISQVDYQNLGTDTEAAASQAAIQGRVSLRLQSLPFAVQPEQPVTHRYLLYAGPTKPLLLKYEANAAEGLSDRYINVYHLNTLTDYSWFGWTEKLGLTTIFVFFTNLMHWLLESLYGIFGNYGVAIIIMTVLVRLLMFPISRKQIQSSQEMSAKMAKVRPEMAKIQEKFKNDPQAKSMAQWELMKKHGVNPFSSCTGCMVVLLQMPIFMGLYYALNESVHLRLAGFLWMPNLAAPDMLVNWSNWWVLGWLGRGFQIPLIGAWFHLGDWLNILPILAVSLMYIQQKAVAPPAMDEQQEMQMKMMNYMMFFFAYMFYWVPSGLCVYFIVSSGWGLLERRFMPKKHAAPEAAVTEEKPAKDARAAKDGKADAAPVGLKAKIRAWWEKVLKEADRKR